MTDEARAAPSTVRWTRRWTRWDGWALTVVTLAGGFLRFWHLTVPGRIVFDEVYYAQDACVFVKTPAVCGIASPLSEEHPLLAKWLIAAGIKVFDFNNDGVYERTGSNPTDTFVFSFPGQYTGRGMVMDKDGGFTEYATTLTVN